MDQLMPPERTHGGALANEETFQAALRFLRDGWQYIGFVTLVFVTFSVVRLAQSKPSYTASASLLVLQQGGRPMTCSAAPPTTRSRCSLRSKGTRITSPPTPGS